MTDRVCIVTGVGEGNGRSLSRRFAREGYAVAMLARSRERLDAFEQEIAGTKGYVCDVTDAQAIADTVAAVRRDLGPIDTLVHNAGSGVFADFLGTDAQDMEQSWRINTLALLLLGQPAVSDMLERGGGNVVVIGATSALRGGANFAPFASAKAAQRSLAQSMARSLAPKGIHVSYIVVDGVVDLPRTRATDWGKSLPDEAFIQPDHVADVAFMLTQQPRSTWTFELDIRPHVEKW
jgi:NAD(P)-dependent dehydrogenase (short-subunit alcohol dehydrogenase family)